MKLESNIIKDELEKLEHITGINTGYKIVWTPKMESKKEGEVLGETIYIYSCNWKMLSIHYNMSFLIF
ncbi:MAG: hypothetical protein OEL82_08515 [Nitrosopumilus sp.]|nr:hypothetical protein [Nitrosopumilus sp.]